MLPNSGTIVTASNQESSKEIATTWNRETRKCPLLSSDRLMGAKARMPMIVAPRSGYWVRDTDWIAAFFGVKPRRTPTTIPSAITMPLSTSMPIAIISAPSEMRCNSISSTHIISIVPMTVRNKTTPTTVPARQPMKRFRASMTVNTEIPRFLTKSLMACSTTVCCL